MTIAYRDNENKTIYTESEVDQMYDEYLDESYDTGIWSFSKLLKDSDPIAYNVGYDDFLSFRELEEIDSDELSDILGDEIYEEDSKC